jgi:phage I-like protein
MASLRRKTDAAVSVDAVETTVPPPPISISGSPAASSAADDGVGAIREQLEALRKVPPRYGEPDKIETPDDRRAKWLLNNQLAQQYAENLNDIHKEVLNAGHADTSEGYFQEMHEKLRQLSEQNKPIMDRVNQMNHLAWEEKMQSQRAAAPSESLDSAKFSAPVSRENISYSGAPRGRVTLTPVEREYARIAGVSEAEYVKQRQRLEQMRADGTYGER